MSSFDGVAEAYRRSFATLCAGTIATLLEATAAADDPCAGTHLDVGCGTGDLARAAVRRGRRVTAVDPDPEMLALSRAAAPEATVLAAGTPTLPLREASAAAITANFVVNHVPDPRAAMADLARVAAPSAPVAVTIWPAAPGPHLAAYGEAARAAGAVPVPSTRLPPERDFERSPAGLAGLAEEAGLRVESAEELHWTWRLAADDLLAGITGGVAGPGRMHRAQTPAVRTEIEARVRELWSVHSAADGLLAFPVTAVLAIATRP